MAARTMPTMPTWTTGQMITSSELNQITTYCNFFSSPPAFRMVQETSQSVANATLAQITCDTPFHDSDTGRGSSTPWSYVIPVGFAADWTFTVVTTWGSNATGIRAAALFQNGAQAPGGYVAVGAAPVGFATSVCLTITIPVAAGDVIAAYGEQTSGGALGTFNSANVFSSFEGKLATLGSP